MRQEQVLIVDDEKRIVDSVQFFLEKEGFVVSHAVCGRDALSLVSKSSIDLVLLDISMPGMDGFEVLEKLFCLDPDILVIMITGYATVESAVKALKIGAWDYLRKPFEHQDLVKTVKNAANHKQLMKENRAVSARLEISEKRCQHMVNSSPDLIYTLDAKGNFTFVNDEFENVLGYQKQHLLAKHFSAIVHPDDQTRAESVFNKGPLKKDQRHSLNLRLKKVDCKSKDSSSGYIAVEQKSASLAFAGNGLDCGEFKGVYCVARDVTERNSLEAQLRQSQKLEAIGTLAGGIAHDFNNILMAIQGYTSLVRSAFQPGSPEHKKLASVDEYVRAGSDMTRQLLGFAQKNDNELSLMNINYLLKMSAKMFGRTKKDVIVKQNLSRDLWSVKVDEGQIKQVLLNLYVNAWQAMPGGGNHLHQIRKQSCFGFHGQRARP
ncbi:MAG: response regulator [Desulfobacteraceae bacterium]